MRLAETATFALLPTGGLGECRNYVQKDDELWLRSDGEMFILAFNNQCAKPGNSSLSVTSQSLSQISAARYDYTPIWKTRQTMKGHTVVQEGWLEILGKPRYQDPYESIARLLFALSAGASSPSGAYLSKEG